MIQTAEKFVHFYQNKRMVGATGDTYEFKMISQDRTDFGRHNKHVKVNSAAAQLNNKNLQNFLGAHFWKSSAKCKAQHVLSATFYDNFYQSY